MISDHLRVARFKIQSGLRGKIVRKIIQGGMVIVFDVEQHGTRGFVKRVNIKTIRSNFAGQKVLIENLIGEAWLGAGSIRAAIGRTGRLDECNAGCFICVELIQAVNPEQFTRQLAVGNRPLLGNWPCSTPAASRAASRGLVSPPAKSCMTSNITSSAAARICRRKPSASTQEPER